MAITEETFIIEIHIMCSQIYQMLQVPRCRYLYWLTVISLWWYHELGSLVSNPNTDISSFVFFKIYLKVYKFVSCNFMRFLSKIALVISYIIITVNNLPHHHVGLNIYQLDSSIAKCKLSRLNSIVITKVVMFNIYEYSEKKKNN